MDSWQSGSESPQWTIAKNFVPNKKIQNAIFFCGLVTPKHTHFKNLWTFNKLNAFLTVFCVTFSPPVFKAKCRVSTFHGSQPTERPPTTVVSGGNFLRSSVRETQRVLEMKRGLNVNGLVGDPISLGNKIPTELGSRFGLVSTKFALGFSVFIWTNRELRMDMKADGNKKQTHCLWWLAVFWLHWPNPWRAWTEVSNGSHEALGMNEWMMAFWSTWKLTSSSFWMKRRFFCQKSLDDTYTLLFINYCMYFHFLLWVWICDVPKRDAKSSTPSLIG